MYVGHGRLCVCLSLATFPHYCTDPDVTCRGCPLVVHYWAGLQSLRGFCCYDNIAPNAKCQRVLVLAVRLVAVIVMCIHALYTTSLKQQHRRPSEATADLVCGPLQTMWHIVYCLPHGHLSGLRILSGLY